MSELRQYLSAKEIALASDLARGCPWLRRVDPKEPICQYESHRPSDWRRRGRGRWVCGICHPPVVPEALIERRKQPRLA